MERGRREVKRKESADDDNICYSINPKPGRHYRDRPGRPGVVCTKRRPFNSLLELREKIGNP